MDRYYAEIDNERIGPMTGKEIRDLVLEGRLRSSHVIVRDSDGLRAEVGTVKGLSELLKTDATASLTGESKYAHSNPAVARQTTEPPPPIVPTGTSLPATGEKRSVLTNLQVATVCATALIGVVIWRLTARVDPTDTTDAAPAAINTVRSDTSSSPADQAPRKPPPIEDRPRSRSTESVADLSWTSAFPNRVSQSALSALREDFVQSTKRKRDRELAAVKPETLANATQEGLAMAAVFWMAQEQARPPTWARGYLYEGTHTPNAESGRVFLGPIPIAPDRAPQELYKALRSSSASLAFVCGFDIEVGPPRTSPSDGDLTNPVYYHVRTLMIIKVYGGETLDREALQPFVGRKIDFKE